MMREHNMTNLNRQSCRGKEILEIKPVIVGGSPTDPANKAVLTREQHIQAVAYWNHVIKQLREERQSGKTGGVK